ncbi:hypothetical protein N7523_007362 [Penicillium sp. IBT 18751x]|nr:hypothetical protein N7523_007362 [Penicillium sp. IBT 18751x]
MSPHIISGSSSRRNFASLCLLPLAVDVNFYPDRQSVSHICGFALIITVELIGYTARTGASNNTGKLMPYIIQSIFVLLTPTLVAAAVYIVLARIIRAFSGEEYSPIRINLITKIFVYCDIVTFFVQGGGAGFMAERSLSNIGQYIILTGSVLQVVTFVIFVITAVTFARRIGTTPAPATIKGDVPCNVPSQSVHCQRYDSHSLHLPCDRPTYVFDAVPMFVGMVCFGIWYPSVLQPCLKTPNSA